MNISKEMINQIAENMLSLFPMITKNILKKTNFQKNMDCHHGLFTFCISQTFLDL